MPERSKRPQIMGVLNVTPDSFSDGGDFLAIDAAVVQGLKLAEEGANIIDIGGESTRPGSDRVSASVQIQRVVPVIEELKSKISKNIHISVDTTLTEVADAAINAGAVMINDVSACRDDPEMFRLAADRQVSIILMHMLGEPKSMQLNPHYENVINEIQEFLIEQATRAQSFGIKASNIMIDPGLGFGKTFSHNLEIISHLNVFTHLGYPVVLGASRKRFLQTIINSTDNAELSIATAMMTAVGVKAGVDTFRVHDVRKNRETADNVFNSLNDSKVNSL